VALISLADYHSYSISKAMLNCLLGHGLLSAILQNM